MTEKYHQLKLEEARNAAVAMHSITLEDIKAIQDYNIMMGLLADPSEEVNDAQS